MKRCHSLPDYKKILTFKSKYNKNKKNIYILRSFSQKADKKKHLLEFFKINNFSKANIFQLKERVWFDFEMFIKSKETLLTSLEKNINEFIKRYKFMKIEERIKKFRLLLLKNKKINFLLMCMENYNDAYKINDKRELVIKNIKNYFEPKTNNILDQKFECKICSKNIFAFLFEDHIKNCYDIKRSKEALNKLNNKLLNFLNEVEKKEKDKFVSKKISKEGMDQSKMNIFFRKTFYQKKSKRQSGGEDSISYFGSIIDRSSSNSILPLKNATAKYQPKKKMKQQSLFTEKNDGDLEKSNSISNFSNSPKNNIDGLQFTFSSPNPNTVIKQFSNFKNEEGKKNSLQHIQSSSDSDIVEGGLLFQHIQKKNTTPNITKNKENNFSQKKLPKKKKNLGDRFKDDSESDSDDSNQNLAKKKTNLGDRLKDDSDSDDSKQKIPKKKGNLGDRFKDDSESDSDDSNQNLAKKKTNMGDRFKDDSDDSKQKIPQKKTNMGDRFKDDSDSDSDDSKQKIPQKKTNMGDRFKDDSDDSKQKIPQKKTNMGDRFKDDSESDDSNHKIIQKKTNMGDRFKNDSDSDDSNHKIIQKKTNMGDRFKDDSESDDSNHKIIQKKTNMGDRFKNDSDSDDSNHKIIQKKDNLHLNINKEVEKKTSKQEKNIGEKFDSSYNSYSEKRDRMSQSSSEDNELNFFKIIKKSPKIPKEQKYQIPDLNKNKFKDNQNDDGLKKASSFKNHNHFFGNNNLEDEESNKSEKTLDKLPKDSKSMAGFYRLNTNKQSNINISSINNINSENTFISTSGKLNSNDIKKIGSLKQDFRFSTQKKNSEKETAREDIWNRMKQSTTDYRQSKYKNSSNSVSDETILILSLLQDINLFKDELLKNPYQKNLINDQRFQEALRTKYKSLKDKEKKKIINKIYDLLKKRIKHVKIIIKHKSNCDEINYMNKKKVKGKCRSFAEYSCISGIGEIDENEEITGSDLQKDIKNVKSNTQSKIKETERKKTINNYLSDSEFYQNVKNQKEYEKKTKVVELKDFKVLKELGKGAFGKVYLVKKKESEVFFAMKVIKFKDDIDKKFVENLQNEINILGVIDGKFLARAYFAFLENSCLFIIMEYLMGGDMRKFLEEWTYLEKEEARYVMACLIMGVKELHDKNIIHRDLKPENMLLNEKGQIKLADFGLSEFHKEMLKADNQVSKIDKVDSSLFNINTLNKTNNIKIDYQMKNSMTRTMSRRIIDIFPKKRVVGTPDYIAPEVLDENFNYKEDDMEEIDWWSVGCLMYEFLVGVPPFSSGISIEEVFNNIKNNKIIWPDIGEGENMMSPKAKDLIEKFLERDVSKRWGRNFAEIQSHPFFEGLDWDKLLDMKSPISINLFEEDESLFDTIENPLKKSIYIDQDKSPISKNKLNRELKSKFNLNRIDLLQQNNLKLVDEIKTNLFKKMLIPQKLF